MSISQGLRRALETALQEELSAIKTRTITQLNKLSQAITPPLSSLELALGLEVETPDKATGATIDRWLSTAPRAAKALPDEFTQELLVRLANGEIVVVLAPSDEVDGPRRLRFCEPWELARLEPHWKALTTEVPRPPTQIELVPPPPLPAFQPVPVPARPIFRGETTIVPLAFGAMRLSNADKSGHRPDENSSLILLRRAFEQGIRLIDTADSYGLDAKDMHHNERLIRRAIDGWPSAERDQILVATKAGLIRPKGRWLPNGSPTHLIETAERSLQALRTDALDLFQLHVKDSRVPFEESLGALARLYEQGKVKRLGLCNVSREDLLKALRLLPEGSLYSLQVQLNAFDTSAAKGLVALTREHNLTLLAHSPLGGHAGVHRVEKHSVLAEIARAKGLIDGDSDEGSVHPILLAYVRSFDAHIIPLFGATRMQSLESSLRALELELTTEELRRLDEAFPKAAILRHEPYEAPPAPQPERPIEVHGEGSLEGPSDSPEVLIVMGIQGAGKTSLVDRYVKAGYVRLNRDTLGGTLKQLIAPLREALAGPNPRVILDNTYPSRESRALVIAAARDFKVPVHCLWLDTPLSEARYNVIKRMLSQHGHLLSGDEIKLAAKVSPNTIPPAAQSRFLSAFEAPSYNEGFDLIARRDFIREPRPNFIHKALLLDVDGTLRVTRSGEKYPRHPDDIELLPKRREILKRWVDAGWKLCFVSNQSGISSGKVSREMVDACFERTIELLGLPVADVRYCPHKAFPAECFCRKPMPGLGVVLIEELALDQSQLVVVGDMKSDREFADSLNARYVDALDFFRGSGEAPPPTPAF